jgi:L-lysine exporter family protein LysE/ArgO
MSPFLIGFLAQLSLITAFGPQNLYVLQTGLRRGPVAAVVAFCVISDIILAAVGVYGLATITTLYPQTVLALAILAALFVSVYGFWTLRRALTPMALPMATQAIPSNLGATLAVMAGLTWLNPHVWIDTVLLLGSVAQTQPDDSNLSFLIGASIGSALWFACLGWGAKLVSPLFAQPVAWRILDGLVGTMMLGLATVLWLSLLG